MHKKDEKKEEIIEQACEEQTDLLKQEMENYKDKWMRAQADYQNLMKETDKRRVEMIDWCEARIIEEFLPVLENLKKAIATDFNNTDNLDANKQVENWKQGIGFVKKQFTDILKQHGVEEIKTVGEKFNPEFHEAVGEELSSTEAVAGEGGTILREIQTGYLLRGKVISVAKVIVKI